MRKEIVMVGRIKKHYYERRVDYGELTVCILVEITYDDSEIPVAVQGKAMWEHQLIPILKKKAVEIKNCALVELSKLNVVKTVNNAHIIICDYDTEEAGIGRRTIVYCLGKVANTNKYYIVATKESDSAESMLGTLDVNTLELVYNNKREPTLGSKSFNDYINVDVMAGKDCNTDFIAGSLASKANKFIRTMQTLGMDRCKELINGNKNPHCMIKSEFPDYVKQLLSKPITTRYHVNEEEFYNVINNIGTKVEDEYLMAQLMISIAIAMCEQYEEGKNSNVNMVNCAKRIADIDADDSTQYLPSDRYKILRAFNKIAIIRSRAENILTDKENREQSIECIIDLETKCYIVPMSYQTNKCMKITVGKDESLYNGDSYIQVTDNGIGTLAVREVFSNGRSEDVDFNSIGINNREMSKSILGYVIPDINDIVDDHDTYINRYRVLVSNKGVVRPFMKETSSGVFTVKYAPVDVSKVISEMIRKVNNDLLIEQDSIGYYNERLSIDDFITGSLIPFREYLLGLDGSWDAACRDLSDYRKLKQIINNPVVAVQNHYTKLKVRNSDKMSEFELVRDHGIDITVECVSVMAAIAKSHIEITLQQAALASRYNRYSVSRGYTRNCFAGKLKENAVLMYVAIINSAISRTLFDKRRELNDKITFNDIGSFEVPGCKAGKLILKRNNISKVVGYTLKSNKDIVFEGESTVDEIVEYMTGNNILSTFNSDVVTANLNVLRFAKHFTIYMGVR